MSSWPPVVAASVPAWTLALVWLCACVRSRRGADRLLIVEIELELSFHATDANPHLGELR